ncbi:hypothetical protein [Microcystis sp.]|uniref:hypothetical protein n=1 Tax=Microcystis sp. TaxID=1127 RepID=UPI003AF9B39A
MTNSRKRWRNLSILTDNNIGIENKASSHRVFIGPRPVGAKHSGSNLSVKPEIFYPNASPVLFQQALNTS